MTRQNLTLLKFPHTTDEIISERIHSLNKLICESGDDAHVTAILEMLISYITNNYTGQFVDTTVARLLERAYWWTECYEPNVTLSVMEEIED